jgi:hypothetical protein
MYTLTIHHTPDPALAAELILTARVTFPNAQAPIVIDATIDQEPGGGLTPHGAAAFRTLALAEVILARALNLKSIDPQEELAHLRAELHAVKAQLAAVAPAQALV